MLASLTEATPRALAQSCGIDAQRLFGIMFGDGEKYSEELALVKLGLAELIIRDGRRRVYLITDRGRRKARQLTARVARRAIARDANRRREFGPVQPPRAAVWPPAPASPTPAATHSFGWSVTCGRTCAD